MLLHYTYLALNTDCLEVTRRLHITKYVNWHIWIELTYNALHVVYKRHTLNINKKVKRENKKKARAWKC